MKQPIAFADLPEKLYPFTLEALHPETQEIVWSVVVEKPEPGCRTPVFIPPLRAQLGHAVTMRARFADGSVEQTEAPR
jgi:hypothetical protein